MEKKITDNNRPIGVFDSGLGGISVLGDLYHLMPEESFIYYGDSNRAPYGEKTPQEILAYSKEICEYFIKKDVKAIVIACNTATSIAVEDLRALYDLPIIGMEPAIKPALNRPTKKKIIVMATTTTLREEKFEKLLTALDKDQRVIKAACPILVEDVEENYLKGGKVNQHIRSIYEDLNIPVAEIDAIVLGCTHFVFLKSALQRFFGKKILLIDGNRGTANHLKSQLIEKNIKLEVTEEKNIETALLEGQINIVNSKSEAMVDQSKVLLKAYYASIKDLVYEDELSEAAMMEKKLFDLVDLSLDETIDALKFNEKEQLIFNVIYGREKGNWDMKSLSKTLEIPQKKLKMDIQKIEKKVFNYIKNKALKG